MALNTKTHNYDVYAFLCIYIIVTANVTSSKYLRIPNYRKRRSTKRHNEYGSLRPEFLKGLIDSLLNG